MESKAMGEELNQMCNLSDCVEELGIQKGMSVSEIADALEETEEVVYRMIDGVK